MELFFGELYQVLDNSDHFDFYVHSFCPFLSFVLVVVSIALNFVFNHKFVEKIFESNLIERRL